MPTLGWRYLLGFTSVPLFIFGILCFWLPESARYHLAIGDDESALKTLEKIAEDNNKSLPEGVLVNTNTVSFRKFIFFHQYSSYICLLKRVLSKPGKLMDLVSREHRFYTFILFVIWFSNAFSYYGIVLLTTEMFEMGNACTVGK